MKTVSEILTRQRAEQEKLKDIFGSDHKNHELILSID